MRIIAGDNRGLPLRAPQGLETRPTSERLRGAVFSALGERVRDASVWDVCAGTGAIGIEALSRGAARALFCETSGAALDALRHNLQRARLEQRATVLPLSWERVLERLAGERQSFELVYFDPPFVAGSAGRFLRAATALLAARGTLVVEHPSREVPASPTDIQPVRTLRSGSVAATLYRWPEAPEPRGGED